MEIEYNRSQGVNYMILSGQQGLLPYEEEMLSENNIPVLLNFHIVKTNATLQYWYDITGRRSVRSMTEREGLSVKCVRDILEAIAAACRVLAQYLITEDKLRLDPDTVFLKNNGASLDAALCFYPEERESKAQPMLSIMEFFLGIVDHQKEDVTGLCYALYEEALRENASAEQLLRIVESREEAAPAEWKQKEASFVEGGGELLPEEPEKEPAKKHFLRREKEEDFWASDGYKDITMEEVFAEDEEEEESLPQRIGGFFKGIPGRLFGRFQKKKEEIFPPKDLEEDLIYDPHADYSEPTVLLAMDKDSCFGKLIYEGTDDESDYMIEAEEFHIGSARKGNQAVLHSPVVSHHHAKIIRQSDKFYIEDLNSTNGTYLNGEAITLGHRYELKYMDRIHFANVPYRIV